MVLEPNLFFHLDGPFQAVFDAKNRYSPIVALTHTYAKIASVQHAPPVPRVMHSNDFYFISSEVQNNK